MTSANHKACSSRINRKHQISKRSQYVTTATSLFKLSVEAVLLRSSVMHSTVDIPIHVNVATEKGKQKTWPAFRLQIISENSPSKNYLHRIQKLEQKCGRSVTGLSRAVVTLSVISPSLCSAITSIQANLFGRYRGFLRVLQHRSKFPKHNFCIQHFIRRSRG